jgi:hypothetical protein
MAKADDRARRDRMGRRPNAERAAASVDPSEIRRALKEECRRLPLQAGAEDRIPAIVDALTAIAVSGRGKPGSPPPAFLSVGRKACERELTELATAARGLITALERLHEPTILALAAVGDVRLGLPETLRTIVRHAERADVSFVPLRAGLGRRPDLRADDVGRIVGHAYLTLTGKRPTFTTDPRTSARSGEWLQFLKAVFRVLGLDGAGDRLALEVARHMKPASDGNAPARPT